mmetsp:Transcript_36448/g.84801  ORF Transcript_36448/g.84801 Transcript_36448/m.84801 type:complete len:253 (-) Transcript_36448:3-761(-)
MVARIVLEMSPQDRIQGGGKPLCIDEAAGDLDANECMTGCKVLELFQAVLLVPEPVLPFDIERQIKDLETHACHFGYSVRSSDERKVVELGRKSSIRRVLLSPVCLELELRLVAVARQVLISVLVAKVFGQAWLGAIGTFNGILDAVVVLHHLGRPIVVACQELHCLHFREFVGGLEGPRQDHSVCGKRCAARSQGRVPRSWAPRPPPEAPAVRPGAPGPWARGASCGWSDGGECLVQSRSHEIEAPVWALP